MFTLKKDLTFRQPVRVRPPGAIDEPAQEFTAILRQLPVSRLAALAAGGGSLDELQATLREVLVGWDGVVDETGEPVPFSAERAQELLEIPAVLRALAEAMATGLADLRQKN